MQWPGDAAGYAGCESNGLPGCGLPNWVAEQPVKHKEQRWCTSKTTYSVIFKVQFHLSGPVLHTKAPVYCSSHLRWAPQNGTESRTQWPATNPKGEFPIQLASAIILKRLQRYRYSSQ